MRAVPGYIAIFIDLGNDLGVQMDTTREFLDQHPAELGKAIQRLVRLLEEKQS